MVQAAGNENLEDAPQKTEEELAEELRIAVEETFGKSIE